MRDDLLDFTIRASAFLKILAGRTRSMLIWELLDGEKSVTALADAVGASATAVSQQLAILKGEGLVSSRRSGQKVFYSLTSEEARRFVSSILEILRHNASTADIELAQPQAA
ncbi:MULTISPECIES: ArsR/SmtB family transcription factor [Sphingomonas]|uniref:ArsR/SmtB family transcription factor n=1 Tax=Sphingomonas TaxID=13687 RepID=UPI000836A8C5|nr:metalloregulator ArsR/SmtB family transcription factor [Sphingomonas pituitosa]